MMNFNEHLDKSTELSIRGEFAESRAILEVLRREYPHDRRVVFNLGWHLCREGRWQEAANHLDAGRSLNVFGSPRPNNAKPIWCDEPLEGRTFHLRCEGGYGDEIICVRFARDFARRGARVVVSCSPSLAGVFSRIAGVSAVVGFQGADHVHCDYWMPAMSAMRAFPVSGEPYLSVNPDHREKWGSIISRPGMKVGLRWSGNPKFEHEQHRRFPPELMLDLSDTLPGATFYSFQRDENLVSIPTDDGSNLIDLRGHFEDFEDTAAAIERMDLVITSCTSIAHLSAALGKPTWVVVPVLPYYCWAMPGEKSPWYDSVTLFRQQTYGDWTAPFEAIRSRLHTFAQRKAA